MTKTNKILLGVSGAALIYFIWKNSKKGKVNPTNPSIPTTPETNEECSAYAGGKLAAIRFGSAEAYNKAWKGHYNECMLNKAKVLANNYCNIIENAYAQGREPNQEESIRAKKIADEVLKLGYTGLGYSSVAGCNKLITIEEYNKQGRI
jgi:hypothetical protein